MVKVISGTNETIQTGKLPCRMKKWEVMGRAEKIKQKGKSIERFRRFRAKMDKGKRGDQGKRPNLDSNNEKIDLK